MRICFIGKYPPIEGGVSTQSYWTLRGLAERGHHVYVVTNAFEVEREFRIALTSQDMEWYEPIFEDTGGFVRVRNTEPMKNHNMSYIPAANPFVSKLASVATQIIRQRQCEIIFGSYFEPYGVAAFLASQWTGVPFILKHAGSDLDRLMKTPDLCTTYLEVVRAAACLLTTRRVGERFLRMGVSRKKINSVTKFAFPPSVFNPTAQPLLRGDVEKITDVSASNFDADTPTVGIYGKVGITKGSFDLIEALSMLKREGVRFQALTATDGWRSQDFRRALLTSGLDGNTIQLPFIPNWRIPQFIRSCRAVCFLERDFPIAIHGPMVPREVMACGVCLIVSKEIADKQFYRDRIRDRENMLIVDDPKDKSELGSALRFALLNKERAHEIGVQAHALSRQIEDYDGFISSYEDVFERVLREKAGFTLSLDEVLTSDSQHADDQRVTLEPFQLFFPCTAKLLSANGLYAAIASTALFEEPVQGANYSIQTLKNKFQTLSYGLDAQTSDIFKYELTSFQLSCASQDQDLPPFDECDVCNKQDFGFEDVAKLRPLRSNYLSIESFDYDIRDLLKAVDADPLSITEVGPKQGLQLLVRLPNFRVHSFKINEMTRDLLNLCNGCRSVADLLFEFVSRANAPAPDSILRVLRSLYAKGAIAFATTRNEQHANAQIATR